MPASLQLVLVTPEKTLLDEPVEALRFPLFDGQIGILPGRAPLLGRLGTGELVVSSSAGETSWLIDGGFVQIRGSIVSLLTNRAVPAAELDADQARADLEAAISRPATSAEELETRQRDQQKARVIAALASRH